MFPLNWVKYQADKGLVIWWTDILESLDQIIKIQSSNRSLNISECSTPLPNHPEDITFPVALWILLIISKWLRPNWK